MGDTIKSNEITKLRLITYLSPSIPVEIFEMIRDYLEAKFKLHASLIYESRWSGPPAERHPDPFTSDEVDIGFMCASAFEYLRHKNNPHIELCKAAPVYIHPNNKANQPIYYSDIIIHADNSEKYKEFHDLKGHKWAYNDSMSLSGSLLALAELKKMGFNSTFFGHVKQSGSNLKSIHMVLDKKVDAASIDSTTLQMAFRKTPALKKQICILTSLGPMPVQPVVFNKRLSAEMKKSITEALLNMDKDEVWKKKLHENAVLNFKPVDLDFYQLESNLRSVVQGLSVNAAYY